jgi:O-antigen/teichoic acid export membrane protein
LPFFVVALLFLNIRLSGPQALFLAAALLAIMIGLQFVMARRKGYRTDIGVKEVGTYWRSRGNMSFWFLVATIVDSVALNVDIVLVGLFVATESAGLYFNAFRTAGLMTLFMFAITLVIAPMVAKHYHAGEIYKAQAVTTLCAWAGFIFSVGIFVIFYLFGDLILSLFGESYMEGKTVLLLLSIGLLVDAATGPTRIVMMMTGHERAYVAIFGTIMLIGFVFQVVLIPYFGIVGAAAINMLARIIAQCAIAIWARQKIGLETSLLGGWSMRRAPKPTMSD